MVKMVLKGETKNENLKNEKYESKRGGGKDATGKKNQETFLEQKCGR